MKLSKIVMVCVVLGIFATFLVSNIHLKAQQAMNKNELITSIVLETFENNDKGWYASGSKYTKTGFPQWQTNIENWPTSLFGQKGDPANKYCFGVRTSYYRMGYNYLWILPKEPLRIPGIAKAFYIWVWGANFLYDFEIQVTDYTGVSYSLPGGKLNFLGWKILRMDIPAFIPQTQQQLPRIKNLQFDRFTIWTNPGAPLENFYIYLDQFSILTDIALETYDGDALNNVNQIWTNPQSNQQTGGQ